MAKYPRSGNWLVWNKQQDGTYQVKDCLSGDVYTTGNQIFRLLRKLDGKHDPQSVLSGVPPRKVQEMLDALSREELVRHSNVLCKSFLSIYYTLWSPKYTRARSVVPGILNILRMLLWLPVCLVGILCFWNNSPHLNDEPIWMGILLGISTGTVAHELSHGLSCLHWGGRVFEIGIMLHFGMPGMYVLMDQTPIRSRAQKVLVSSAGIETNMMLVGIFTGLSAMCPEYSFSLFMAATTNLWLALINLLPISSLDGMHILSLLMDSENADQTARTIIRNKRLRRCLLKKGFKGCVVLLAGLFLAAMQYLLFPALMILSLSEVFTLCRLLLA